ncbi:unnamed protein product (macronuclear) [Paramecium tetraurelia]|uniref:Uncharacterized protein n=1 Tax=Paramecium tetraurelia TaxID=5888 RepID=A0CUW4_PARTE|nr:uncharacterized protein GSPATT00039037001 [Paramecium tetraurelia]CAK74581.1 unnamed protein product [Paramecium tetraurelia]|eukprot:XP_001441978.1 hypothetical protein (macronuclear) [Paramecium tetraurelia strain d4-2]
MQITIQNITSDQNLDLQARNHFQQSKTSEYGCDIWDSNQKRLLKIKYRISTTIELQRCSLDGEILKIVQNKNSSFKLDLLTNLEQIKYLECFENYLGNYMEVRKWTMYWGGEQIQQTGGFYSKDGLKQGLWNQLIKQYSRQYPLTQQIVKPKYAKKENIFMIKNLVYGHTQIKIKLCIFIQQLFCGGGWYSSDFQKNGKWVELSETFWNQSQVTYNGEYKGGKKVNKWDTIINGKQIIGGGFYNTSGSIKIGKWIEVSDGFWEKSQITYVGEYQNGKKVGRWDFFYKSNSGDYTNELVGGGSYDDDDKQEGVGVKIGKWIELNDGFQEKSYVILVGQYKHGEKVGKWDIFHQQNNKNELIGGGFYGDIENQEGIGIKIGKWVELSDGFWEKQQIIQGGQYKNGNKIGRWNILDSRRQIIGGGQYDETFSFKCGKWIELNERFSWASQVTSYGEYKNNNKVGRWDIVAWGKQIGGGSYQYDENQDCETLKIGRWNELSEVYGLYSYITNNGEYKNGKKIGRWDILWREDEKKPFQQIGGGTYDQEDKLGNSVKNGKWIELSDGFRKYSQVTYSGEYRYGKKVGIWEEIELRSNKKIKQINYYN